MEVIDKVDGKDSQQRSEYGLRAKERIKSAYSWEYITRRYADVFCE